MSRRWSRREPPGRRQSEASAASDHGSGRGGHERAHPGSTPADLREAADIDSVDFLNLVIALGKRTGVEIPDRDAGTLTSIQALAGYITAHAGSGS